MEAILGLTANDSGLKMLLQVEKEEHELVKFLCRMLGDLRLIAEGAIKSLINLSASDPLYVSLAMLKHDVIHRIMRQLDEESWRLKNLSLMVLANVTISTEGSKAVVRDEKLGEILLTSLTHWFMSTEPEPEGTDSNTFEPVWDDEFQYVANILANITQVEEGREFLWQQPNTKFLIEELLPQLRSPNVIRRRGICNMYKNLAFEKQFHEKLFDKIQLVPKLLFLIAGPEKLSEDDKRGMDFSLTMLRETKCREHDEEVRGAVIDTLLLLCATRDGRERCRAAKVYPIVRDAHLVEQSDVIGEQIYKLVGLLMRDEEGQEPDWNEIAKEADSTHLPDRPHGLMKSKVHSKQLSINSKKKVADPEEEISDDIVAAIGDFKVCSSESEDEIDDTQT